MVNQTVLTSTNRRTITDEIPVYTWEFCVPANDFGTVSDNLPIGTNAVRIRYSPNTDNFEYYSEDDSEWKIINQQNTINVIASRVISAKIVMPVAGYTFTEGFLLGRVVNIAFINDTPKATGYTKDQSSTTFTFTDGSTFGIGDTITLIFA